MIVTSNQKLKKITIKKGNFVHINMITITDKNNHPFWNFDRFRCLTRMIEQGTQILETK